MSTSGVPYRASADSSAGISLIRIARTSQVILHGLELLIIIMMFAIIKRRRFSESFEGKINADFLRILEHQNWLLKDLNFLLKLILQIG